MKKTAICLLACAMPLVASAQADRTNPVTQLDTLTVYSTRATLPLKRVLGKVEVIAPSTIERSGLTDLTDLLKAHSTVDVLQYPSFLSNVGIRGFAPDATRSRYVAVLINGIPSGTANLSTLGLSGVQQIEILKGPFSSIYGTNAMGGVINIITKKHTDELTGSIGVNMGSEASGGGVFSLGGGITDRLSFDLSASYDAQAGNYKAGRHNILKLSKLEEAILDPTQEGAEMPESKFGVFKGNLRLGYNFGRGWSLNLYQDLFLGKGIPGGGTIWGVYGVDKKDLNRSLTSAELRGQWGAHQLTFSPYYTREWRDVYNLTDKSNQYVDFSSIGKTYGAILQDELTLGRHKLVLGLDARNEDNDTKRFQAGGSEIEPYNPNYTMRNLGLYAQANFALLGDALTLSAGLRADFMTFIQDEELRLQSKRATEHYNILSPNLGLKYQLAKGLTAHASIGSAFSAPDASNKAGEYTTAWGVTRGNPELKPETSTTWELGINYTSRDLGIQLDATYFDTHHKQKIVSVPAGMAGSLYVITYANADKARMRGLELVASYDFGSLSAYRYSLRAYVNATWMFASEMKVASKDAWQPLEGIRQQNLTFGLEYNSLKGLELGLTARFLGKRYERDRFSYFPSVRPGLSDLVQSLAPEQAKMGLLRHPAALVFSASAHYNVTRQLRLGLNLHNLLSEYYTERDGYPMPGRQLRLSASYRF